MAATNRLALETSPYLRQHASNPVDWYPWGPEALERAVDEDRPILLSVGYSACHWCHVMAHESFEDDDTADLMNRLFVNIKVDREERPDVDAVYMDAVQAMTGQGGWPMTVFMTPDGRPFFAGTYFPRLSVGGRPSFTDLCNAIDDAWTNRRSDLEQQADDVATHLRDRAGALPGTDGANAVRVTAAEQVDWLALMRTTAAQLEAAHDDEWGGFGRQPKFPQASMVELCLRAYQHQPADELRAVIITTLDAMLSGGIYDHLGGGFARYATDRKWLVPHFEKMLYDNAQLVRVYLHGYLLTGNPAYRQVVEETVAYVLRDLRHELGGFFCAEDADSEGVEGRFYVWDRTELDPILGAELAEVAAEHWGVTAAGNWEGHSILHLPTRGALARSPQLETARQQLLQHRNSRVRPGLDDKVLTEWSAMMISALSEAGASLCRPDWVDEAAKGAHFLLQHLRRANGRWLRAWHQDGNATLLAYAADHAHLVEAFTRLYEATGTATWIDHATTTAADLLRLFTHPDTGLMRTVGSDGEQLLIDRADTYDGATPSPNSVAAMALLRLAALTGNHDYSDAAQRILVALLPAMAAQPQAMTNAVSAAALLAAGPTEVVVSGPANHPAGAALRAAVTSRYLPDTVLAWGEPIDGPLWEGRTGDVDPRAFVCRSFVCKRPVTSPQALAESM